MGKFQKLKQRMAMMVTRVTVRGSSVGKNGQVSTVDMLQGIDRDDAEVFEPYGVSSFLPPGAAGVGVAVGGSSDQLAVLGAAPRGVQPTGKLVGEVDFYSIYGQVLRMHTDGSISHLPGLLGSVYLGSTVNPALPYAAAGGDLVIPGAALITWMAAVTALLPPGTPVPVTLGTITPVITRRTRIG